MTDNASFFHRRPLALLALGLAVVVVAGGLLGRRSQAEQLGTLAAQRSVRTVAVVSPSPANASAVELPGRIEAWARAPIHARVGGYLKQWSVDIGSPVKAGQVLAEIETPELDQQLMQAQAELATALSNLALAVSTAERWQALLGSNAVSRQEVDEKVGDRAARESVAAALHANVERLRTLQQYKRLVAPFDGVVTARNTDIGALINVGMTPGSELFVVADTRRLRVYVRVPQRQVAQIRAGGKAELGVPERPAARYAATVQSLAQAIDAGSGAMLVQLSVDNPGGDLLPGGFATVRFDAPAAAAGLTLPPAALIVGRDGVRVATVDGDSRIALRPVTIVRDRGNAVELAAGLGADERVVANPPDGLEQGDLVRVAGGAQ